MNDTHLTTIVEKTLQGLGDSDQHLLTLASLVVSTRAKNVLELGVREGSTTLPLLWGVSKTGGHLHSVDLECTPFNPPNDLASYWTMHVSDSIKYLESLSNEDGKPLDFVLIDDWHGATHVQKELALLDKWMTPSSIIVLHDTMYTTCPFYHSDLTLDNGQWEGGGPYCAVAELPKWLWEFSTIPVGHGLTLLRKKHTQWWTPTITWSLR